MTPPNATAAPTASHLGMPSPRNAPAPSAMRIGPIPTIIAVVPASRVCSAMLSATLYAPNHARPNTTMSSHSRAFGRTHVRRIRSSDRKTVPTRSRPRASSPPPMCAPTPRITTKALAHARIVTPIATRTRGGSPRTRRRGDGCLGRLSRDWTDCGHRITLRGTPDTKARRSMLPSAACSGVSFRGRRCARRASAASPSSRSGRSRVRSTRS